MAITTFSELQTAITNWLDDNGIDSYRADFITLGENRIKRELRVRQMMNRATATMPTSDRYLALPAGYVAMKQLQINSDPLRTLQYVPEDQINLYHSSSTGKPYYYTITGDDLQFERTPDSAYTAEITFYKLTALSASNTTNELFPEFAELYLHASLIEGLYFNQEDERAKSLEPRYSYLKDLIEKGDASSRIPDGTLIMKADTVE